MRFGISLVADHLDFLRQSNWDYGQLKLISLYNMTDEEVLVFLQEQKESRIKFETADDFFLSNIALLGSRLNIKEIRQYSNILLDRASQLGIDTCIISNPKNRAFEEYYGFDRALIDFKKTLEVLCEIGQDYNINIALEGASYRETNMVNLVLDAYKVIKDLNLDNLLLSASFYHMRDNKEDFVSLYKVADKLGHINISTYSQLKGFPLSASEERYGEFFNILKDIGYKGRVSVKASSEDLITDSQRAIDLLYSFI